MLCLWRDLTVQCILASKQGSAKQRSLPGHHGHVTTTVSPSPPSPRPRIGRCSPQFATSHVGKIPKGKARCLTILEMSEHTTQTIIIAPDHPVAVMTKGSSRRLRTPAKQVGPSQLSSLGVVKKLAAWEVNGRAGTQNDTCLVPKPTMFFSLGTLPV